MKHRLNIFIDESGDFGDFQPHSPFYLVTMLFHNQANDIERDNAILDANIKNIGFDFHALHTGPIIRREGFYFNNSKDERRKLLRALLGYCRHVPIQYTTIRIDKRECLDIIDRTAKLSLRISRFISAHIEFFHSFDEIVVHYDNGQLELTRILTSTLTIMLSNVSFRKVQPSEFKLFQLADMFCALELVAIKFESKTASRTEMDFFNSARDFSRNYFKEIRRKRL